MNIAMISVAPDVLSHLLALRLCETESLDDVLRRVLAGRTSPLSEPTIQRPASPENGSAAALTYQLFGATYWAKDATEAMINILRDLAQLDQEFLPKLAVSVRGRTRNHIARSRTEVYPRNPTLVKYVKDLVPGWFIGCNIANCQKRDFLRAACNILGFEFGRDLRIDFPNS